MSLSHDSPSGIPGVPAKKSTRRVPLCDRHRVSHIVWLIWDWAACQGTGTDPGGEFQLCGSLVRDGARDGTFYGIEFPLASLVSCARTEQAGVRGRRKSPLDLLENSAAVFLTSTHEYSKLPQAIGLSRSVWPVRIGSRSPGSQVGLFHISFDPMLSTDGAGN